MSASATLKYLDAMTPSTRRDHILAAKAIQREFKPDFEIKPYWLIHHAGLLEWNTEPIQNRIDYIRFAKPWYEQETRLKWMRPVLHPDRLPADLVEVGVLQATLFILMDKPLTTQLAYSHALHTILNYLNLLQNACRYSLDAMQKIEDLHREECPECPFDYDLGILRLPPGQGKKAPLLRDLDAPDPLTDEDFEHPTS
jgi:hypothetical protein